MLVPDRRPVPNACAPEECLTAPGGARGTPSGVARSVGLMIMVLTLQACSVVTSDRPLLAPETSDHPFSVPATFDVLICDPATGSCAHGRPEDHMDGARLDLTGTDFEHGAGWYRLGSQPDGREKPLYFVTRRIGPRRYVAALGGEYYVALVARPGYWLVYGIGGGSNCASLTEDEIRRFHVMREQRAGFGGNAPYFSCKIADFASLAGLYNHVLDRAPMPDMVLALRPT